MAETLFLRAYFYFDLVRFFENIPLFVKPLTAEEVYEVTQADPADVYNLIISDLQTAIEGLPVTVPVEIEGGRATVGAARALLGKVYLQLEEYTKAADLYEKHLQSFPGSPNVKEIKAAISKLTALGEKTDYAAVTAATASGSINRIDAYRRYLKNHPEGQQIAKVKKLISAMEGEYFAHTEKQIAKSAMQEEWVKCSQQVKRYSEIYPDSPKTEKLLKFLPLFEKNRLEFDDYEKAVDRAQAAGTDYAQAHKILSDYLQSFPNTHMASKVEAQIARYKKMDEETKLNARIASLDKLLAQSEGRFNSNGNGTITDKRTGLMWSTLDSKSVLDSCLNYESATAYIKSMNTGGHGDWRLPKPEELNALFKVKPYFPASPATWLWTSKVLRKYEGEWLIDVTVVTADNSPSPKNMVKDSRLCGNVRAVRRASR